jgi:hypothetical protein
MQYIGNITKTGNLQKTITINIKSISIANSLSWWLLPISIQVDFKESINYYIERGLFMFQILKQH